MPDIAKLTNIRLWSEMKFGLKGRVIHQIWSQNCQHRRRCWAM